MTVKLIGSPRKTSEEARLDKNRRIKESIKATKAKRKTQTCSTFDLKIVGNKLSSTQREALVRVFLEAKWLWNECIASGDPFSYKPRKNVLVKTKDDTMDEREYRVLGSQMKQSLVKTIRSNIKTLATLKKQGRKTGTVVTGRSPHHSLRFFFQYFRLHRADGSLVHSTSRFLIMR